MTDEQKRRRFKFPGATPEALAKALLRPVQPPREPTVSVQLGEDDPDPENDSGETGNSNASLRDDPESSNTT